MSATNQCGEFRELAGFLQARYLSMWRAYIDDSGHGKAKDNRVFVLAGFIGTCDDWLDLIPQWHRILSKPEYNVRYFHSQEFAHSLGDFTGWDKDKPKRERFLNELLDTILDTIGATELHLITSAVLLDAFDKLPDAAKELGTPYRLSFLHCLTEATKYSIDVSGGKKVAVMFEETEEFSGMALEEWREMKKNPELDPRMKEILQTISYGPKIFAPLQVADLIAYETNKYVRFKYGYDDKQKEPRYQIRTLLKKTFTENGGIFDDSELMRLLSSI